MFVSLDRMITIAVGVMNESQTANSDDHRDYCWRGFVRPLDFGGDTRIYSVYSPPDLVRRTALQTAALEHNDRYRSPRHSSGILGV